MGTSQPVIEDNRSETIGQLHDALERDGVFAEANSVFDAIERGENPLTDTEDISDVLREARNIRPKH